MPSGSAVQVEIAASFGQFQTGLNQASSAMREMVQNMKGSLGQVQPAAQGAATGTDGLFESMRHLKTEAVQHGRVFNYYGQQLAGVTGIAKGVGAEIAGLGIALASGMWIVAAIEGVKMVAGALSESSKAADEFNKQRLDAITSELKGVESAAAAANDALWGKMGGDAAAAAMERKIQMAKWNLDQLQRKVAAYQTDIRDEDRTAYKEALEQYRSLIAQADLEAEARRRIKGIDTAQKSEDTAVKAAKREQEELAKIGKETNAAAWQFQVERASEEVKAETDKENQLQELWKKEGEEKLANMRASYEQEKAETRKYEQEIRSYVAPLKSAMSSAITGLIDGSFNLRKAWTALWQGMVKTMVDSLLKMGEEALVQAILGKVTKSAVALAEVTSEAAVGGAGVAAWMASNPFTAAGAIPAGEAMAAAILGAFGPMASAAGGWDRVPYDTMAMVHKDEKILPADKAKGLDDLIAGGGGVGGGPTVIINAVDAKSVRRLLLDNDDALGEAIKRAMKNGRL